jgi:hypothetical protein
MEQLLVRWQNANGTGALRYPKDGNNNTNGNIVLQSTRFLTQLLPFLHPDIGTILLFWAINVGRSAWSLNHTLHQHVSTIYLLTFGTPPIAYLIIMLLAIGSYMLLFHLLWHTRHLASAFSSRTVR